MLRVVESFSGIGSQVKALKNIGIEHEIVATIDWDINAIIAYDIIHNGAPDLTENENKSKEELINELKKYTLSKDGKKPITDQGIKMLGREQMIHLLSAIQRSNNLGSITDVVGTNLPEEIDLFTYSFPCQDLSIAGAWHGNNTGIDRKANNRSGMLWEVERILLEIFNSDKRLPKFLLMENVSNILSNTHKVNFKEWQDILSEMGYINKVYTLKANNFGIPQKRERVYMLSVLCNKDENIERCVMEYLDEHDLQNDIYVRNLNIIHKKIEDLLRVDYSNEVYKLEANEIQPNDTESRRKISKENDTIYDGKKVCIDEISTITTKQDRNPNSGVIKYNSKREGKSDFRYLTPRECFLFMGFDESDFDKLIECDFKVTKSMKFFLPSKLYKFAGNSIVVNVLEAIFKQVQYINENYL